MFRCSRRLVGKGQGRKAEWPVLVPATVNGRACSNGEPLIGLRDGRGRDSHSRKRYHCWYFCRPVRSVSMGTASPRGNHLARSRTHRELSLAAVVSIRGKGVVQRS